MGLSEVPAAGVEIAPHLETGDAKARQISALSSSPVRAGHLFFSTWSLPLLQFGVCGLGKTSLSICPGKDLDRNGGLSESAYFILCLAAAGDGCINAMAGIFEVVTL